MSPRQEKSQLKRGLPSAGEENQGPKKARRNDQAQPGPATPVSKNAQQPSPITHSDSLTTEFTNEATVSPPHRQMQAPRTPIQSPLRNADILTSPPSDTQVLSQFHYPAQSLSHEVEDEEAEGVWGYLIPLMGKQHEIVVLKKRAACPVTKPIADFGNGTTRRTRSSTKGKEKKDHKKEEEQYEAKKRKETPAGGYLVGRHPECDIVLQHNPTISNRHCLLFMEQANGNTMALVEDLSGNGTFVNDALVGRNKRRELSDGDEISIVNMARFVFRYPRNRKTSAFLQQYTLGDQLGKGHFASVYMCVERSTGQQYAVKVFTQRKGVDERSKNEGLQQEIAVLMSVSHPNLLCLKDTFAEDDRVYLVLELAAEGELFNWIIMHSKLSEDESRRVFIQLFQGVKYLHDRGIVHRDIKPENILLVDKNLTIKIADFGLAKIIGEESFTTTLCGTPSYVAPEILQKNAHRKYTHAVDIWSLGVVLYICLCGFPPFSDELTRADYPYSLSEQIKRGMFDYPSPYWDPVSDLALDLIDKMLKVDMDERITIEECLEHPWITMGSDDKSQRSLLDPTDSIDGLTPAMNNLDFSKRKVKRARTLLSEFNKVVISKEIETPSNKPAVKIFQKNPPAKKTPVKNGKAGKEIDPSAGRAPEEFMNMGGKGDEVLFDDEGSKYEPTDADIVRQKGRKK